MKTFIEAYSERLQRNHATFIEMAEQLKQMGCIVFAPKDKLINFIQVFKDDKHIVFGFSEVPYKWYLQICFKPSKEHGNGRTIKEIWDGEDLFTIDEIIENMVNNPNVKDFTNPFYLTQI